MKQLMPIFAFFALFAATCGNALACSDCGGNVPARGIGAYSSETLDRIRAETGDAAAQLELGRLYLGGMDAFPRREANPQLAAKCLRLAAAQGSAEASELLSTFEKSNP